MTPKVTVVSYRADFFTESLITRYSNIAALPLFISGYFISPDLKLLSTPAGKTRVFILVEQEISNEQAATHAYGDLKRITGFYFVHGRYAPWPGISMTLVSKRNEGDQIKRKALLHWVRDRKLK